MKETIIFDAEEFARGEDRATREDDEFDGPIHGPSKEAQAESFREMVDLGEIDQETYDLLMTNL